ncbi:WYL domain-containing protein [Citrobacter freundii]|uniref:helix-turn-helix transcriptional regulator n=1 Tax=Citrobacter freundii TaxID=546 RepID=UPI0008FCE355|nr:WYL domain-containing protein [Citrobacter freundii]EKW7212015.1 WYL domain-containing protein [Citrobacter freundii]ELO0988770.1 WYL domain-containing protein [Citrobacter freundii]MDE8800890.1 WYL domain-containing protein [Citrobacter freundii]MDE8806016.1 WYL domain-containing protein [Citrobacter freundii]OIZ41410.1 transcriptional regulator [Citrobacter freundii]
MVQTERRHDRLAVRLSIIISRLLAGETLSVQKLAAEFAVSPRTLRRDFRERLMYMDLEYHNGICRLRSGVSGTQRELDILTFAHRSGLADLFPGLDRRLVSTLLESEASPCLVWPVPSGSSPALALSFYRLIKAITARQQVGLQTEGQRTEYLSPYRLVAQDGVWYLVAEHNGQPAVFRLDDIQVVQPTAETFRWNEQLYRLSENPGFVQALPHFRCIRQSLDVLSSS